MIHYESIDYTSKQVIYIRSYLACEAVFLATELAFVKIVALVDEAPSLAAGRPAVERVLRRRPRLLQGLLLVRLVLRLREDLKRVFWMYILLM